MVNKTPVTSATRFFEQKKVDFVPHIYKYEEKGGTKVAAISLQQNEATIIKTLVMETEKKQAFIVLMHGDREVSLKNMARFLKTRNVTMCSPEKVTKLTGYLVGGTSPFATKNKLPIYCEKSIHDLPEIWINAGKRGFLAKIKTSDLVQHLVPINVEVSL